jgi:hypothetical protein
MGAEPSIAQARAQLLTGIAAARPWRADAAHAREQNV